MRKPSPQKEKVFTSIQNAHRAFRSGAALPGAWKYGNEHLGRGSHESHQFGREIRATKVIPPFITPDGPVREARFVKNKKERR